MFIHHVSSGAVSHEDGNPDRANKKPPGKPDGFS
jgi:hypothetical protein